MNAPQSLSKQRFARCRGELHRGCGIWPKCWCNSELEPPFEPFNWSDITRWDLGVNGFDSVYQGQFADRLKRLFRPAPAPPNDLYNAAWAHQKPLQIVTVQHYADDEITYAKAEQLLLALGSAKDPIAFELFGIGKSSHPGAGQPRIEVRFALSKIDVPLLEAQLHILYPRSAVITRAFEPEGADFEWADRICGGEDSEYPLFVVPLYLAEPYCFLIRTFSKRDTDPLATAIAVLDELGAEEWALVQVLFGRAPGFVAPTPEVIPEVTEQVARLLPHRQTPRSEKKATKCRYGRPGGTGGTATLRWGSMGQQHALELESAHCRCQGAPFPDGLHRAPGAKWPHPTAKDRLDNYEERQPL